MNRQHWEVKHDWMMMDIYFELWQTWQVQLLLRKHPDDEIGYLFRDMLKELKKSLDREINKYKKVYGRRPNLKKMRELVEDGRYIFN